MSSIFQALPHFLWTQHWHLLFHAFVCTHIHHQLERRILLTFFSLSLFQKRKSIGWCFCFLVCSLVVSGFFRLKHLVWGHQFRSNLPDYLIKRFWIKTRVSLDKWIRRAFQMVVLEFVKLLYLWMERPHVSVCRFFCMWSANPCNSHVFFVFGPPWSKVMSESDNTPLLAFQNAGYVSWILLLLFTHSWTDRQQGTSYIWVFFLIMLV